MTRGFSLVSENGAMDVWVMDPAVDSVEQTINIPDSALSQVRSVEGVRYAAAARAGYGRCAFSERPFPELPGDRRRRRYARRCTANRRRERERAAHDAVIVDAGGTSGKLETPISKVDQWPHDGVHLDVATRELSRGDELLVNDHLVRVLARSETLPRFPPRPLISTLANAARILPPERHTLTFVMASAVRGVSARGAGRAHRAAHGFARPCYGRFQGRYRAVVPDQLRRRRRHRRHADTGHDHGLRRDRHHALHVHLREPKHYAVLKALGAPSRTLLSMIFAQASVCALLGTGLGLGVCGIATLIVVSMGFPVRMMWFTPLIGIVGVVLVSVTAATISARPVLRLQPAVVFAGR